MAILALLAVVGGVMSDVTSDRFWERHAVLAGMVSSVIVVVLSIAVINEVLERRRRQRWSILAQYVMFELIRNARMIWSGVLEAAGLFPTTSNHQASIDAGAKSVRDTPGLAAALRGILDDADSRARLHAEIVFLAEHSDEVLGRWAAVMLNARSTPRCSTGTSSWSATSHGSLACWTLPTRPTTLADGGEPAAARRFRSRAKSAANGSPTELL